MERYNRLLEAVKAYKDAREVLLQTATEMEELGAARLITKHMPTADHVVNMERTVEIEIAFFEETAGMTDRERGEFYLKKAAEQILKLK